MEKNDLKKWLNQQGINEGFLWILINKVFSMLKGPISAIVQIAFLSPEQQGFWYTFASLGALSAFAELGFTQIITQYVSQEFVFLNIEEGHVVGEKERLDKFHSLISYSLKFYFVIIPTAILILSIAGFLMFKDENINILLAWGIYSISGGFALLVSLFQSIYQGLDKVADIQKNILKNLIITTAINWGLLALGFGIFALSVSAIIGCFVTLFLLYRLSPVFWKDHFKYKIDNKYKWGTEIIPMQLKYAVGFAASYFIYQLYVPTAFKIDGSVISGQLGLTFMLVTAVRGVSDAFIGGSLPQLNFLAAEKKETSLLNNFKRLLAGSVVVNLLGGISILLLIYFLSYTRFGIRFSSLETALLIVLFNIPINFIGVLGHYTLLHKDASLYPLTILAGLLCAISMFFVYPMTNSLKTAFIFLDIVYWGLLIPLNIGAFFYKKKKFFLNNMEIA